MTDLDTILNSSYRRLVDRGFRPIKMLRDPEGEWLYGVRLRKGGEDFYMVAKERLWDDLASFLQEVVHRAKNNDCMLILYVAEGQSYLVFDPTFVLDTAEESEGESKKRWAEWYELPVHHGVGLEDYLHRRDTPDVIDTSTLATLPNWEQ